MRTDKKNASRFVPGTDPRGTEQSAMTSMAGILAGSTVFAQLKRTADQHGGWVPLSDIARATDSRKDTLRYRLRAVPSKYLFDGHTLRRAYHYESLPDTLRGRV